MNVQPFSPGQGATYNQQIAATTAATTMTVPGPAQVARIINAGPDLIAFRCTISTGTTSATAVFATDTVMLAGTVEVFSIGFCDTISVICPTSTAAVYISIGEGQ